MFQAPGHGYPIGLYSMPEAEYHADRSATSFGQLSDFMDSPAIYKAKHIDGLHDSEETRSMRVGSCTHILVCEPDTFNDRVGVKGYDYGVCQVVTSKGDQCSRNAIGKCGKCKQHGGEIDPDKEYVITEDEYQTVVRCARAIKANPKAMDLIDQCFQREHCARSERNIGGELFLRRARFDLLDPITGLYCPLKTSADPRPDKFRWSFRDFHYGHSQAWYEDVYKDATGCELNYVKYIVVGTAKAYPVCWVHTVPNDYIEQCREEMEYAMIDFMQRLRSQDWSDYESWVENELELSPRREVYS